MLTLAAADTLAGVGQTASTVTCTIFGMELSAGTETYKVLDQRQLANAAATIYTVPASTQAFVKAMHVVNTNAGASQTFQLFRGGTAAANAITAVITLPAGGTGIYEDGEGWRVYNSDGSMRATGSVLTTKGDIHVFGTAPDRLAVGANSSRLLADSTQALGVKWQAETALTPIVVDITAAAVGTTGNPNALDNHRHALGAHGIASHTDVTRNLVTLGIAGSVVDAATLVSLGVSPNLLRAIAYADAATQGAFWSFTIPDDWASGAITVQPYWVPGSTDGVAHTVRWSFTAKSVAAAGDVTAAGTTTAWTGTSATRTANLLVKDTATSTTITPAAIGDLFMLELQRIGADAADTYVGVVNVVSLVISYTATQ